MPAALQSASDLMQAFMEKENQDPSGEAKSVPSQFHRRVTCVRRNKRTVGESKCGILILRCR